MKEGTKIIDQLNVFNTLICQLGSMDVKIEDEDKATTLLCSLPESWNHLVTSISFSIIVFVEFDSIVGAFLFEEVQRNSNVEASTSEKMVTRGRSIEKGEGSRDKSRSKWRGKKGMTFWYCNKSRHLKKDCWKRKEENYRSKKEEKYVDRFRYGWWSVICL